MPPRQADSDAPEQTIPLDILYKAKLHDALLGKKETRDAYLGVIKTFNPDVRIPEVDTTAAIEAKLKPVLDRADAAEKKVTDLEAKLARKAETDELVTSGLVSAAELPEVEKIMTDKGIANRKTAAEHFNLMKKVATPRAVQTPIQLPNYEGLMKNPTKWARGEALKYFHEIGRG